VLIKELLTVCENAFAVTVKLCISSALSRAPLSRTLLDLFHILCLGHSFDDPTVLCTACIVLDGTGSLSSFHAKLAPEGTSILSATTFFGDRISQLDSDTYDRVLQEVLTASTGNISVIRTYEVLLDRAPEGLLRPNSLIVGPEVKFAIGKLLFGLTRNVLMTMSSEKFIEIWKCIHKILKEKVPRNENLLISSRNPSLDGT
jgi:hypothetical protein